MKNNRRGLLVKHLSGGEFDQAIVDAQKADETRLIRRLCYVKNLYHGDTREGVGDRVGISRSTTRRWARAWNEEWRRRTPTGLSRVTAERCTGPERSPHLVTR
jgi:hypothetical protein